MEVYSLMKCLFPAKTLQVRICDDYS